MNITPLFNTNQGLNNSMNRRNPRLPSSSAASNKKLKSSRYRRNGDDEDRISNLSDNIIHHILFFLNMEQAVQTSVLSRRWRFLWSSLPFLKFDTYLYGSRIQKSPYSLKGFIDQVLLQRDNSNIHSFDLVCASDNHLNAWILYALRFNVQELRLVVAVDRGLFRLPHRLFTCTSLTVLKLHHWDGQFCANLSLPDSISLPMLRKLHIQCISFQGSDDLINKFISGCPLLESLSIRNCEFRRSNLNISSLKLKHLKIERYFEDDDDDIKRSADGCVKLYAPNLISFRCKDFMSKNYSLGDLPSLVKADIDMAIEVKEYTGLPAPWKETYVRNMMKFVRAVQHLKALTLSGFVPQILSRANVLQESRSAQFCNLRYLKLITRLSIECIDGITYLLKICPNIETLSLTTYLPVDLKPPFGDGINFDSAKIGDDSEGEFSSEWSLHHLKCVELKWVLGCVNELKFLQVVLKHSLVLEKLLIAAYEFVTGKQKLLKKFREKLLTSPIASPHTAIVLV